MEPGIWVGVGVAVGGTGVAVGVEVGTPPLSVTFTPTPPPASLAVPLIVVLLLTARTAPDAGLVMVEVGGVRSVLAVAAEKPATSEPGCGSARLGLGDRRRVREAAAPQERDAHADRRQQWNVTTGRCTDRASKGGQGHSSARLGRTAAPEYRDYRAATLRNGSLAV
jgi:hypothetical protein